MKVIPKSTETFFELNGRLLCALYVDMVIFPSILSNSRDANVEINNPWATSSIMNNRLLKCISFLTIYAQNNIVKWCFLCNNYYTLE